jgi:post-segregation antitoxin (ccd killing protein)
LPKPPEGPQVREVMQSFKLMPTERDDVKRMAREDGLNVSAFIRSLITREKARRAAR